MSKLQGEGRQHRVANLLRDVGVDIRPEAIGITYDHLRQALIALHPYAVSQNLAYSVVNEKEITSPFIDEVIGELRAMQYGGIHE